ARGWENGSNVGASLGRPLEILHVTAVPAIQPVSEPREFPMIADRRDAAEIESELGRAIFDLHGAHASF
ncbi:MAG TPA: hypothetical protein VN085_07485, partial [Vicinamibacterales bacterium]|nr:hypothetical protein [Vicinamibacterales bacterium]